MKILITAIYVLVVGLVCFFAGLIVPRSIFDENKFPYKSFKWEDGGKIYDKLHIKSWKAKLPEMSKITKLIFPKKLKKNMTADDFDRLVKESCIAELSHYVLCVCSLGIYYIWRGKLGAFLALIYGVLGNVTYIIIQRYNRPHFIAVRDKLKVREERRLNAGLSGF
ncbi:MAG: hypothetical protein IJ304_04695 [Clostridia bacterium]|nr:hypothetical protein [Clostridia bacterium]